MTVHLARLLFGVFSFALLFLTGQAWCIATAQDDSLVRPNSDGVLILSAEIGKAVGPKIEYMPEWKAFGWFSANDSVSWNVWVTDSGEYDVFMEWSVSDEEAGNPWVFRAGGTTVRNKVGKTGSWETFKNARIGSIQLTAGQQLMTFGAGSEFDGYLMDLRGIKLIPIKAKSMERGSAEGPKFRAAVGKKEHYSPQFAISGGLFGAKISRSKR